MTPLLEEELVELEALLAKTTPGPWEVRRAVQPDNTGGYDVAVIAPGKAIIAECFEHVGYEAGGSEIGGYDARPAHANASLIVAQREALPRLLTTIRDLRARVEALTAALTPNAETKASYMGEFSFKFPEFDEDGGEHMRSINVPWTTIKEIMKAIREEALPPVPEMK
jgi:hypothetical protein